MTEKRMKILHVLTDRNIGGAGRWLLYYLKYHNREKFAVKVVLPHDSLLVAAVQALDVPVLAMEEMEDKSFDRKAFKALAKIFRAEKPDIVHTHASMTARMAARRARVPYIFNTKHCMEGAPGGLAKKILRREINAVFSDKIIAVSKAVRRSMQAAQSHRKLRWFITALSGFPFRAQRKRRHCFPPLAARQGRRRSAWSRVWRK